MSRPSVVVIGGGAIGLLTGWFLRVLGHDGSVRVLERDLTYRRASTALSAASIRSQFACAVNVELSLFGARFLKSVRAALGADVDIGFRENGYLVLGDDSALEQRREALAMQRALGADIEEIAPERLEDRFEWLSRGDVAIATLGRTGEGWFDAWALLQAARRGAAARGVEIVAAEATGFELGEDRVRGVRCSDGSTISADIVVVAAGALSGRVARWAGVDLPVSPRKRTVFNFRAPLPGAGMPMLFDISGAWVRPEGDGFIGGVEPDPEDDADAFDDFEPQHHLFESRFWPLIAGRVPAFEQVRLRRSWAGHYEMNLLDHNGVVGPHTELANLLFATGFSGHGVMHAPGVARGVAEHILGGRFRSIDLSPLGFERIANRQPLTEAAIY